MPVDITQQIATYEAGETQQFTYATSPTIAATVAFNLYDFTGNIVPLASVQGSETVSQSLSFANSPTGHFFINRVLPNSPGFYFAEFMGWDASSRPYPVRWNLEVIHTGANSFWTYCDVEDVIRNGRQIFARANMSVRDIRRHIEAADAWINTKLGGVVSILPIVPTPDILRGMSKAGAYYFYYSERYSIDREAAPPGVVDEWDRYNDLLDGVVAGSYSIANVTVNLFATGPMYISTAEFKPIFDLRDVTDQRVDPDLIIQEWERD